MGFVVLDGQNPFYNDVVRGAEDEATRHGIAILYGNTDEDLAREKLYLDLFEEQQVRGLLIAPYGDVNARLQRLRARGIAAVLVDRFSGDGRFSSVSVDSVMGGRMAVEHLIDTGRRRIAFVGGPFDIRQVNDRLAGARVAAENAGATRRPRSRRHGGDDRRGRGRAPARASSRARAASGPTRSSPPTTCSRSGCCNPWSSTDGCWCPTTSRSSGSTTSRSPPRRPCRCRRSGSRAA